MKHRYMLTLTLAAIVGGSLLQCGCEEAKGLKGLQVDPASVSLSTNGQTVAFTVTGGVTNETLALPLTWSVRDAGMGTIAHHSGYTAIYQRSAANGANTVIVRDQFENEGYATIRQLAETTYSLELTAEKISINVNEAVTITVTTESAQAPFTWRLVSGSGSVAGSSGASAVYSSSAAGTAVIEATDANGASGVIGITVIESSDGGGGDGGPGGTDP
ncbi:MAG TPA: hypothetical protein DCS43_09710 [Verrucomicrobia bacterium]|nr:hypothetical protein [Verrucomicrobiota bacterium]